MCASTGLTHLWALEVFLLRVFNTFIKENRAYGILLCKDKLVDFCKLSNWKTIIADKAMVYDKKFKQQIMV